MISGISNLYRNAILGHPVIVLVLLAAVLGFFSYQARDFTLDASADSLILEDDPDLRRFRETQQRYQTQDLLVVTYTPRGELFSDSSLSTLKRLRDRLRQVESVDSILSLIDVPLLTSAGLTLSKLTSAIPTLEDGTVERSRARQEILESPVFSDLILSRDGETTALLLSLREDPRLDELTRARSELIRKRNAGGLDAAEAARLESLLKDYDATRAAVNEARHRDIQAIRAIIGDYQDAAELYLGGVPMITDDMVTFIRRDLVTFGIGVLLFMIFTLTLIFRRRRWVILPLLSCLYAVTFMIGMLGLLGWRVTVISSNFISLMLIITLSMNIHLIVRYRQLAQERPGDDHRELVSLATRRMVWPCLYTALTTILGFSSLVFSDIKPVIDFGWMMSIGLAVTFVTSFLLFPSILALLGRMDDEPPLETRLTATRGLAWVTEKHGGKVLLVAVGVAVASAIGISRLEVENSFINYFSRDTEIYRGMKLIDEKLGGTTPLQVLLNLEEPQEEDECANLDKLDDEQREECADLKELLEEQDLNSPDYWFTPFKIDRIKRVHDYLDQLPEVGKVLSIASMLRVGEQLNEGKEFTSFEMAILFKKIPEKVRASLIDPYISIENNEARIALRILDSREDLRRKELLDRIRGDLRSQLGLTDDEVSVTGILVLYNNMLQSLFRSQILTVGVVLLGIAIMFLILFRSVTLAIIGIIPNALAAGMVLGIMGLLGVPLDMMTITVAAITIGIAVDNSIHYIYRFREEFPATRDYLATLRTCHANIGRAVLYTSITIIFGFSILVFSNFIPTIYFGLLTAFAMFVALLAALTLLPKLILIWRPFGDA